MNATRSDPPGGDSPDRPVAAVRAWVAFYTRGLSAELAETRRALMEAELWDEARAAEWLGETAVLGRQRWSRLLRGIPADLVWRLEQRGRATGAQRRTAMHISKGQLVAIGSVTILYAVILFMIARGVMMTVATSDPARWAIWGAIGLVVSLIGLLTAIPNPRAGFLVGLIGTAVSTAAMPWNFYIFLLVPSVLGYRLAHEREIARGTATKG